MDQKKRKHLFLFFTLLFFTISPTIVFLASGYRYNFKENLIQKTGIIEIRSNPSGVPILFTSGKEADLLSTYLSSQKTDLITPITLTNLLPEYYKITLTKENYWDYQKTIDLKPNEAQYIKNANLLKKGLPELIIETNSIEYFKSPNNKFALIKSDKNIGLLDIKTNIVTIIEYNKNFNEIYSLEWSQNSTDIIINSDIYNIKDKEWVYNEKILPIKEEENQSVEYASSTKNNESEQLQTDIANYPIQVDTILSDALGYTIFKDNKFIIYNTQEIWIYNSDSRIKELLTRTDNTINSINIAEEKNYLVYTTNTTIHALELNEEGYRNNIILSKLEEIIGLNFDQSYNTLYFEARIGQKKGLYKLNI
ncbi:PEGA domain-containing protein [Patescibacteria group bacterium]|nr:PEGA domain-containing protein [Patescibacteria group bacterium]